MGLFHHNRELTLRRNETMLRGKFPSNNGRRQKIPSDVPPKVIIIIIIYLFFYLLSSVQGRVVSSCERIFPECLIKYHTK